MISTLEIRYISISGNTRSFVNRLVAYAEHQTPQKLSLNPVEISDTTPDFIETEPFVIFLPTYLEGGNGIDNGDHEIMTVALREHLRDHQNFRYCRGVIGSGNRNFNAQYCLTARQYTQEFGFAFIGDYELRGTSADLTRIYQNLVSTLC